MPQDFTNKQFSIANDVVSQSKAILAALDRLQNDAGLLVQAGGNFEDPIFQDDANMMKSNLTHLDAYHINVMLQEAVPALTAFFRTKVNGNEGLPTYRELLEMMISSSY